MNALQQFLQAASNEAAGAVSAPVDLLGWGLRKMGVPVPQNALMSSDWMRQNGLMADVPQNAASLAGSTAGLLSPFAVAAKAPQIARGLLSAGDNLAAPRTLKPEAGALVWHGSPHKFDKFDASKIGTGEGLQAYGHGLYLAESPEVALTYKAGSAPTVRHMTLPDGRTRIVDVPTPEGNLYKVDLPDEAIARMLDWDKPLSQQAQSEAVKRALDGRYGAGTFESFVNSGGGAADLVRNFDDVGRWGVESLLRRQGIPGIRYLDGGSRGAGQGSSNFVVFPGEENILRILERNGQPLR
jgi:hypothetical protein